MRLIITDFRTVEELVIDHGDKPGFVGIYIEGTDGTITNIIVAIDRLKMIIDAYPVPQIVILDKERDPNKQH